MWVNFLFSCFIEDPVWLKSYQISYLVKVQLTAPLLLKNLAMYVYMHACIYGTCICMYIWYIYMVCMYGMYLYPVLNLNSCVPGTGRPWPYTLYDSKRMNVLLRVISSLSVSRRIIRISCGCRRIISTEGSGFYLWSSLILQLLIHSYRYDHWHEYMGWQSFCSTKLTSRTVAWS